MTSQLISYYDLLEKLGAGGMGEVYLARDTRLGRKIALKLLPAKFTKDQDRLRRFVQEACAASALNHPNILTIHEIGETADAHFIATEFIEGVTLRAHMTRTRMKLHEVVDIATQVAAALVAAHAAGIVHRDIKPENIMVRPDGYIKVLDFGLAKLTEKNRSEQQVPSFDVATHIDTDPGVVMGTVTYMSPEQARGLAVDVRTDIWSLGVVLYEMVLGRPPFEGATNSHVIVSILEREPDALTKQSIGVPDELEQIVKRALAKRCEKRYQVVEEMFSDLRRLKQRLELEDGLARSSAPSGGGANVNSPFDGNFPARRPARRSPTSRRRNSRKTINSIAVLPLINTSDDPHAEYLSDGITESIINTLSQLPKLRVMARSTVFRYKGREVDPQTAGRELDVRAVLAGRVLQINDRLVIKTELIDVTDGTQLWGEQYNRSLTDIFAVQEEISREISGKLRLRLTGEEQKRLAKRHTDNTAAYQLYLKGRYYWNKRTPEDFFKGIEFFKQAIELDPTYALAYAGLADSYNMLGTYSTLAPAEAFPRAKAAAVRALEIDPTLAEAHTSLAYVKGSYDWDWKGAEHDYMHAIELNRNYATAHYWYAITCLTALERFEEAIAEMKRALDLDPLSLIISTNLGWILYFARRFDEAIEQYRKTLEMDANFSVAHFRLAWAYQQKSLYAEAIAEHRKAIELSAGNPGMLAGLGRAYALAGEHDEAHTVLDELTVISKQQYVSPYFSATIYAGLGDTDRAFAHLQKAFEDRSDWLVWLKVEPGLDSLRSDPRFTDLLRRMNLSS